MKVRTCQSRKSAPSTTAVVSKAMATVRITCEVEARAHPTSWLGTEPLGSVRASCGFVWVSPARLISLAPTVSSGGTSSRGLFSLDLSGVISESPCGL